MYFERETSSLQRILVAWPGSSLRLIIDKIPSMDQ